MLARYKYIRPNWGKTVLIFLMGAYLVPVLSVGMWLKFCGDIFGVIFQWAWESRFTGIIEPYVAKTR